MTSRFASNMERVGGSIADTIWQMLLDLSTQQTCSTNYIVYLCIFEIFYNLKVKKKKALTRSYMSIHFSKFNANIPQ